MALLNYLFISSLRRRRHYLLVVSWAPSSPWICVQNRHSCSSSFLRRRFRRPVFVGPYNPWISGWSRHSCNRSSLRRRRLPGGPTWAACNHVKSGRIGYSYSRVGRCRRRLLRRPASSGLDSPSRGGSCRRSCSTSGLRRRRRPASWVPYTRGTGVPSRHNCNSSFLRRHRRRLLRRRHSTSPSLSHLSCACSVMVACNSLVCNVIVLIIEFAKMAVRVS